MCLSLSSELYHVFIYQSKMVWPCFCSNDFKGRCWPFFQVLKHEESASDSDKSDDRLETLQLDLTKLHDTNSSLLSQIAEMTETERSLREQLSNSEDSLKSQIEELQLRLVEGDQG